MSLGTCAARVRIVCSSVHPVARGAVPPLLTLLRSRSRLSSSAFSLACASSPGTPLGSRGPFLGAASPANASRRISRRLSSSSSSAFSPPPVAAHEPGPDAGILPPPGDPDASPLSGGFVARWALICGALFAGLGIAVAGIKFSASRDRAAVAAMPLLPGNPVVFLDVEDGAELLGRLVVQLRADAAPRAAANFRDLCSGARGFGYASSPLHGGEKHTRIFGGDFYGAGRGGYSIYGDTFEDEALEALTHCGPGTVSMRNYGPDTNNSQFFITLRRLPAFDGVSQVVGYVCEGFEVLEELDKRLQTSGRFPLHSDIRIRASGVLPASAVKSAKDKEREEDEALSAAIASSVEGGGGLSQKPQLQSSVLSS